MNNLNQSKQDKSNRLRSWMPAERGKDKFINRYLFYVSVVGVFTALITIAGENLPSTLNWLNLLLSTLISVVLGWFISVWWEIFWF